MSRKKYVLAVKIAPTVSLVGGGLNYGRVQVSSDGVAGSVCDWEWESKAADVVCRQINSNFTQGEVYYDFPPATGEVMLHVQSCSGIENSLLKCANDGWRNVPQACLDHSHDVGVYCYGKVHVVSGTKTHSVVTGRVEVRPPPDSGDGRDWIAVCGEGFDQQDAEVVCREMGFDRAKVLAPGSFGVKPLWKFYTNMTCKPGGLDIHSDCTYDKGVCKSSTHNYASVMCYKSGTDPHQKFYIENGFHGLVIVEEYGLNGTVCVDGWSDRDATVLCRSKGYKAGVVLGVPEIFTRTMPIWYTNVSCTGREGTLADCSKADNVPIACSMSLKAAGVLCYKTTGVSVHLANSQGANYYGRVEVEVDGVRGTICDYDWSTYDARVTCSQLGFVDGEAFRKSFYGNGNGSIVLSGMTCDSMERSLLECPSMGWNNIHVICNGHDSDAGVFCKRKVMTDQAENYGAVKVWNKGSYYLVCAEGFDDLDALVVCRTMGYTFGKSLCCDAFGQQSAKIGFSSSMCTGQEVNYEDCLKVEGQGACPSNQYASVVCSREAALPGFEISIEEYDYVTGSGPLLIEMQGQKGYMCAEDFDDKDATVACRQLGYIGGYAYKYYNEDVKSRSTMDLRWLRGPNCTGLEERLDECPGINIANVSGCFVLSHAAVFCYKDSVLSDFEVRLSSAPHPGEGFVQVKVNNTWGSICTYDTLISDFEATVVCQQLHFKYGINIPIPSYPRLTGKVWLNNMNCVGKEHSVQECLLSGMGQRVSPLCQSHSHDMAVKCYAHVRLAASITPNFGMVQVLNETGNHWVAVCDTGFDDTAATVVCRNIGYKAGKAQCCSSIGSKMQYYNPIEVFDVKCPENETDFTKCSYNMSKNVVCPSGNYVSVLCTDDTPPKEDLHASIVSRGHFGNVEVSRYGVQGALCDLDWDDNDAMVLCRELNYTHGFAANGTNTAEKPILLTGLDCYGNETSISQCRYPPLILGHGCSNRLTRAAVFCSLNSEPIQYRVADLRNNRGRAEIYVNGMWGTICDIYWQDKDADVFCRQTGYLGGESTVLVSSGHYDQPIWMSHVECTGKETNFMQCRARWDEKAVSRCSHFDDAGVKCYKSARLNRGDYHTHQTNGIVEMFMHQQDQSWYTVCADTFTDKEAEVVCRVLGHDHGMAVCCSPYGYNTAPMARFQPKCNGTEKHITDCELVPNSTECARQNYASVTCYNGSRTQTEYSVALKGSLKYTGQVVLEYMGVPGRICWTDWSDEDARVICREMGFKNGSAYYHYKSTFIYLNYNGPYWTSNVQCLGNETQLSDCPHTGFGYVTDCNDRGHYAGVICFDDVDVAYRISGGDSRYGRVEFTYDGTWHTICSSTWGQPEANVTCRQLGYVTGDTYNGDYSVAPSGKAYTVNFRCTGGEEDLGECPHEGIQESMFCQDHKQDEGVFCYTSVKLSGSHGYNSGNGTVLYYLNDSWSFVCNDGFTDVSAKRVCQELGFADGRSICCAAFGTVVMIDRELSNYSLQCENADTPLEDCLVKLDKCTSGYASVVCFKEGQVIEDDEHTFELEKASEGQIMVTHYGVTGRICSRDWDDNEAKVFCRGRGFKNGIAYQRSESNVLLEKRGPYWLGGFNCTGNESSIMDCPHLNRTNLDNCTAYDIAAVLCYNDSGIQYRLADGSNHYGRVEIQIGGRWGTVCDQYWDRREASVICRQLNFTDGEAVGGAHFGRGKGPIWISHLECKGTEAMLHQCPHRGFTSEFSFDWWFPLPCETHGDDAGVFCYQSVRLNRGPSAAAGGLEVHRNGVWYGVCDTGFTRKEALVVCKSLKSHYVDALALGGSAYGNLTGQVGFSRIKCNGSETDLTQCDMTFDPVCPTGHYASVYCSNKTIVDDGFSVRLAGDSLSSRVHGILEARVQGIWGRVCLYGFDDKAASVVCRQFGYDGGVAYLHIMKNDKPVLVRDIRCNGTESSLTDCTMKQMSPDLDHCHYGSNDAGVICYNNTGGTGFDYRLNGGSDPSNGRVEIGYGGRWGMVCAWSWQTADASVLCRALGYKDGIVSYDKNISLGFSIPWVTGFFCTGNEASPMTCLNTGFNSTFLTDLCMGGRDIGAFSQCYREHVVPKDIRLVDGPNNHTGRVEVFVTGANEWGTICDDYWDNMDARVACSQLGLYGGTALKKAPFGPVVPGTGRIWFDNMKCKGNESTIFNCSHRGLGTHNCNHTEDVGVICQVAPPPTSAPVTTTTLATTAPPVKTTPKRTTTVAPTKPSHTTTPRPPSTQPPTTRQTLPPITTPAPTPRPTTTTKKAPVTAPPATTMKQETTPKAKTTPKAETTPKPNIQTTAESPKEQTTHSKISPVTTEQTTRRMDITVSAQSSSSRANIGVIVAVPLVIIFVIAIIVAFVVIRFRRRKASAYREHFDDSVISRHDDGTVTASNQLYDLNLQPTSPGSTFNSPNEDNMMLGANGSAHYSKGVSDGDNKGAFSNPLYDANKDFDSPIEGQVNGVPKSLPAIGEITFPENDILGNKSNA